MPQERTGPATGRTTTRRSVLGLLAGGGVGLALGHGAAAAAVGGAELAFRILRAGDPIGEHRVAFAPLGAAGLRVTTEIEVAVRLAFVTLYRFGQRVEAIWQDGRMTAASIEIRDQGERRRLTVDRRDGVLVAEGPGGLRELPADCVTDIDFWTPEITRRRQVLDTWTGEVVPLDIRAGPVETLRLGRLAVDARRFSLRANRGRSGEVWYTSDGTWVRGRLRTRGEMLEYLPRALPQLAQSGQT